MPISITELTELFAGALKLASQLDVLRNTPADPYKMSDKAWLTLRKDRARDQGLRIAGKSPDAIDADVAAAAITAVDDATEKLDKVIALNGGGMTRKEVNASVDAAITALQMV